MEQTLNTFNAQAMAEKERRAYITPSFSDIQLDKVCAIMMQSGSNSGGGSGFGGGGNDDSYTAPGGQGGLDEDPFAY